MHFRLIFPGLDSFRGRYLYLAGLSFLLISLFVYTNWRDIHGASQLTRQNIIYRNENTDKLNAVINQFQYIKFQVYQFALNPEPSIQTLLTQSVSRLAQLTSKMDITIFDSVDAKTLNNFIYQIPVQLQIETLEFIAIRSDNQQWIPATRVMNEELLPLNEQVITTLTTIIDDEDLDTPESSSLKIRFLDIKTAWLSIIAQFRLLTADRLGIFKSSNEGINSRLHNLAILTQDIRVKLNNLDTNNSLKAHGFIYQVPFQQLKEDVNSWLHLHTQVVELLQQPNWRRDIIALENVDMLLENFSQTVVLLTNELSTQSNRDIQSLNEINDSLSLFFVLLIVLGLLIAFLGYLFFDRNILRPISRTTHALFLQSQGISQELDIRSKASETGNLIEAFNQMREQINLRETRLDFIAHHDALTQLPNRLLFNERLKHAMELTERSDRLVSLMLLDLDRFKVINDTFGHLFGDQLLRETASRLKYCMRAEDTIARLGGDEFAIIAENFTSTGEIEAFAQKIIKQFAQPFFIDQKVIHASTSIGIAMAPLNTSDPTTLIRYADIAMYQSKHAGRNQFTWFHHDLENTEEE